MSEQEKRDLFSSQFNKLTQRQQVNTLYDLSRPFMDKGAIKHPAKTLEEIFELRDKSIEAKKFLYKGHTSNQTPPKKKRK